MSCSRLGPRLGLAGAAAAFALAGGAAHAGDDHTGGDSGPFNADTMASGGLLDSGKLLLTGGVSNIEGAGGGGLATWATITGYESDSGVGANVHATYVGVQNYSLTDYGVAVGFANRVELSYARQQFDTGATGALLGLGKGFTFDQDVFGAKVRLIGDVVFDQNSWLPEISAGVQYKTNDKSAIVHAVGAKDASGTDFYIAATKLFLDQSVLVDTTVRFTKANQTGLLGFGGDKHNDYEPQFEGSVAYLVNKHFAVGAEVRTKPDNLGFAREDDWYDVFAAYAINKHLSFTVAYANLGDIATLKNQNGVYVSLQAGF
ncbi:MAG TPA: DUF3034 family protein [Caulobacteraceae bacterium]|jgi:hypothetical protein|nr:DUF3034 family protein [Caulobacteraceae bacterium]